MEEEKAVAYYDEKTRKGERATRFKQGLDFSSSTPNDNVPKHSSSFLSKFVKASSESKKQAQLQSIHDQLKEKPSFESRVSSRDRDSNRSKRRSRSREKCRKRSRSGDRYREMWRRSRSRGRHKDSERERWKIGLFSLIFIFLHRALCFPIEATFYWCRKSRTKGKLGYSVIFLNSYL